MVKPRFDVRQYELRGRLNLWSWAEEASVITFREGHTIVFREELRTILRGLDHMALPPFGAIVLVLSALQDSWRLSRLSLSHSALLGDLKKRPDFAAILDGLDKVHEAWNGAEPSSKSKGAFLHFVFDRAPQDLLHSLPAEDVIEHLFRKTEWDLSAAPDFKTSRQLLEQDLKALRATVTSLNASELASRVRTSLDHVVAPVDLELPQDNLSALDFLRSLEGDDELGGLARLAAQLIPCTSLPKWVDDPDDTQQGGVSDITNRGDLDRLLLSELAQDDLTLAVRVALRESLYLRRESPPGPPSITRVVFVDLGIRSWGVNRVFAMATGLALALHAPGRKQSGLFSGVAQEVTPIDFSSREGLLTWMETLDSDFDPFETWQKLLERPQYEDATCEFVLVTSAEVMADADFRAKLSTLPQSFYIATTDRRGDFRLIWRTPVGQRRIRDAKLDLSGIVSDKVAIHDQAIKDLPAVYYLEHFPLLFSSALAPERTWLLQDHARQFTTVFSVDNLGQLLRYTDHGYGAEVIAQMGAGKFHLARTFHENKLHFAIFGPLSPGGLRLLEYNLETGANRITKLALPKANPLRFALDNSHVYVFFNDGALVFHASDGQFVMSIHIPSNMRSLSGRYFTSHRQSDGRESIVKLCCDSQKVAWREEPMANLRISDSSITMIESDAFDAKRVLITDRGRAIWPHSGEYWDFWQRSDVGKRIIIHSCARNGRQFLFQPRNTTEAYLVDLENRTCDAKNLRTVSEGWRNEALSFARQVPMRRRFRRIRVNKHANEIELVTGREAIACIRLRGEELVLAERDQSSGAAASMVVGMNIPLQSSAVPAPALGHQTFEWYVTGLGKELDLMQAVWKDGSQAVWDNRGFLSLKSSDRAIPECTLAISDSLPIAGWVSDGRRFGPRYFHPPRQQENLVTAPQIFHSVIRPFMERIS